MNPWPIAPITDKDLDFAVVKYDFTSFAGNEQAELPSLEGAIDLTLIDFAASIADQIPLIASLFDGLNDLGIIPGEIDSSDNIGSTLSDLNSAAGAADASLADFTGQIGGSTGGGGGGGGGTAPSCATQDFGSVPTGTQKQIKLTISNNANVPITIKNMQVAGNSGANVFEFSPKYTNQRIAPGASVPLTITALLQNATPQVYSSTLSIFTDQPDPQPCMTLKVTATQGVPPPPGGGGGGGDGGGGCDVGFSPTGKLICLD